MIFYGPSGTGKTLRHGIIAQRTNRSLRKLSATTAEYPRHQSDIAELDTMLTPGGVCCISMRSMFQQAATVSAGFIEDGRIALIASTTENQYFLRVQRDSEPFDGV